MATATAVKQEVTQKESQAVIQNLINVGISEILHKRGVLPDEVFQWTKFGNQKVKKLRAGGDLREKDKKSLTGTAMSKYQRVSGWLPYVKKCIADKYAKKIIIEILKALGEGEEEREAGGEEERDDVIERYVFSIDYAKGSIGVESQLETLQLEPNKKPLTTHEEIKGTTEVLIRNLVTVLNTYTALPDKTRLAVKVVYTDDTPAEYADESAGFSLHETFGLFDDGDFSRMDMGGVCTRSHSLSMSLLWKDSPDLGASSAPPEESEKAQAEAPPTGATATKHERKRKTSARREEADESFRCSQDISCSALRMAVVGAPIRHKRNRS